MPDLRHHWESSKSSRLVAVAEGGTEIFNKQIVWMPAYRWSEESKIRQAIDLRAAAWPDRHPVNAILNTRFCARIACHQCRNLMLVAKARVDLARPHRASATTWLGWIFIGEVKDTHSYSPVASGTCCNVAFLEVRLAKCNRPNRRAVAR